VRKRARDASGISASGSGLKRRVDGDDDDQLSLMAMKSSYVCHVKMHLLKVVLIKEFSRNLKFWPTRKLGSIPHNLQM